MDVYSYLPVCSMVLYSCCFLFLSISLSHSLLCVCVCTPMCMPVHVLMLDLLECSKNVHIEMPLNGSGFYLKLIDMLGLTVLCNNNIHISKLGIFVQK